MGRSRFGMCEIRATLKIEELRSEYKLSLVCNSYHREAASSPPPRGFFLSMLKCNMVVFCIYCVCFTECLLHESFKELGGEEVTKLRIKATTRQSTGSRQ